MTRPRFGALLRRILLLATPAIFSGAMAVAQCVPAPLPPPSATTPIDLGFGPRNRARVVTTGNFDGTGTVTAVSVNAEPIIRVDSPGAGSVTVRGNSNSFTYTFPASGSYAVVFPFPTSGANPRVTFRVTAADGPRSGGTATWAGPGTVVTGIDNGEDREEICVGAEVPGDPRIAARLSNRLSLAEIGTWRQRTSRKVGVRDFVWARAFGGGGIAGGSQLGVQAGFGRTFAWGEGSVFFSYADAAASEDTSTSSASHVGGGVTATFPFAGDAYVDVVARLAHVTRVIEVGGDEGRTSGLGYAVSAEAGVQSFAAGPARLQPELQLVVTGASLPAFSLPSGGTAAYDSGPAIYARAGLAALQANGGPFWARADIWTELQSGTSVAVEEGLTGDLDALAGETWGELTLGFKDPTGMLAGSLTARTGNDGTSFGADARVTIPF